MILWFEMYYPYEDQLICSMEEDVGSWPGMTY